VHSALSVVLVGGYVLFLTVVALRARAARQFTDFSIAGRTLPLALVFGSLAATYVGPVFSIGFVGKGFGGGFLFWCVGLAYAAQNIIVGLLVAPKLRALKGCHTLGDAVGQKYDRVCQILAGIISVGVCAGLAAVMAKAGADVVRSIFPLRPWPAVLSIVGVTALYTTFGGLRASVVTDAFQFTAFATLMPAALLWVLLASPDGSPTTFAEEAVVATRTGFGSMSVLEIAGLVTAFLLGETLIPPYANRALASRTTGVSRNGFILAGLFSIAWFAVMVSLGIAARNVIFGDPPEDSVLLILVESTLPPFCYTLLLVVLISVIMSSLDSLLNAGAVAFTRDIVKPFAGVSERSSLNIGRAATIAIALTAAVGAVAVKSIVSGLLICYTVWAPAILPALIIGLWTKRPRPLAGILSMGVGAVVAVVFEFYPSIISAVTSRLSSSVGTVPAIIPALTAALAAYALGHWVERTRLGT